MATQSLPALNISRSQARFPGRLLVLVLAGLLALGAVGAGAWWFGLLGEGAQGAAEAEEARIRPPVIVQPPDVTTSIIVPGRRTAVYVQVRARLVVTSEQDAAILRAMMPRVVDVLQVQLREMHQQEFQRSHAISRLRGEVLARIEPLIAPAKATDLLFDRILVQ